MNSCPTDIKHAEALAIIGEVAARHCLASESIALSRTHGRVLAQDLVAPIAQPSFDSNAMDGDAMRRADLDGVETNAPLGANVHRAGEEVRAGEVVLHAGQVLTPARVSLAASLGFASLYVARRPTVAVFTSGDELVEPGMALAPGQAHDSNRELLMGLLRADGLEPTAWPRLPDDPRQVEIALRDAGCAFDLIIICGAVSDCSNSRILAVLASQVWSMARDLARFGQLHFRNVQMSSGMQALFGSLDQARLLGLPGHPASVLAPYLTLGRALIDGLQGRTGSRAGWRAQLVEPIAKSHPQREYLCARVYSNASGCLLAEHGPASGLQRLHAAAECNALIVVPEGPQRLAKGDPVEVLMYA